ncbi:MAG: hypothetical protein AAF771_05255 [Pseudomonadota bacterium]
MVLKSCLAALASVLCFASAASAVEPKAEGLTVQTQVTETKALLRPKARPNGVETSIRPRPRAALTSPAVIASR